MKRIVLDPSALDPKRNDNKPVSLILLNARNFGEQLDDATKAGSQSMLVACYQCALKLQRDPQSWRALVADPAWAEADHKMRDTSFRPANIAIGCCLYTFALSRVRSVSRSYKLAKIIKYHLDIRTDLEAFAAALERIGIEDMLGEARGNSTPKSARNTSGKSARFEAVEKPHDDQIEADSWADEEDESKGTIDDEFDDDDSEDAFEDEEGEEGEDDFIRGSHGTPVLEIDLTEAQLETFLDCAETGLTATIKVRCIDFDANGYAKLVLKNVVWR